MCYVDLCCFLPRDPKFRHSKKAFNGEIEMGPPPELRSGFDLQIKWKDLMLF